MNGISWVDSWRRAMLGPNCEYKNQDSIQFQSEKHPIEAVYAVQGSTWRLEAKDRSLLVKIHKQEYEISCEVLNRVFSNAGNIESIEVFAHDTPFHSRIIFCEPDGVVRALHTYNGRCIYDGCCEVELSLGYRVEGKLSQIGAPDEVEQVPSTLDQTTRTEFFEAKLKEIERLLLDWRVERHSQFADVHDSESRIEIDGIEQSLSTPPSEIWKSPSQSSTLDKVDESEVSFNVLASQQHMNSKQEFVGDSIEGMELCSPVAKDSDAMKLTTSETRSPLRSSSMEAIEMILQFGSKSKGCFRKISVSDFSKPDMQDRCKEIDNSTQDFASSEADSVSNKPFRGAHQVFDKMPKVNFGCLAIVLPIWASVDTAGVVKPLGFGWRRIDYLSSTEFVAIHGAHKVLESNCLVYNCFGLLRESCRDFERLIFVFDPGGKGSTIVPTEVETPSIGCIAELLNKTLLAAIYSYFQGCWLHC